MKASTQYNDFVGTSAADISDHTTLDKFLKEQGVDTERYQAIGAGFYGEYGDFSPSIFCVDKQHSTSNEPSVIQILLFDIKQETFFNLFKRIDVVFSIKVSDFAESYRNAQTREVNLSDLLNGE